MLGKVLESLKWLMFAFLLEGIAAYLLRGETSNESLVLGALCFLFTAPFFVKGMGGIANAAYFSIWNIGILFTHGFVGVILGELPTKIPEFLLGCALSPVMLILAAKVSAEVEMGAYTGPGEAADDRFETTFVYLNMAVVSVLTAIAVMFQTVSGFLFASVAFSFADVAGAPFSFGVRQWLFKGRKMLLIKVLSEFGGFLPSVTIYTVLLRGTMESLMIVAVVTAGFEVFASSVMQSIKQRKPLKGKPLAVLIALTVATGYFLSVGFGW